MIRRAFFLGRGMWILTILLLFHDGSVITVTKQMGRSIEPTKCMAEARKAVRLKEVGLHVLSATCARAKIA